MKPHLRFVMAAVVSATLVALTGPGLSASFASGPVTTTVITAGVVSISVTTGGSSCPGSAEPSDDTPKSAHAQPTDVDGKGELGTAPCVPTYLNGQAREWPFRYVTGAAPSGISGFTDTDGVALVPLPGAKPHFSATVPIMVVNDGSLSIRTLALTVSEAASHEADQDMQVTVDAQSADGTVSSARLFNGTLAELSAGEIVDLSGIGELAPGQGAWVVVTFSDVRSSGGDGGEKTADKSEGNNSSSQTPDPLVLVTGSDACSSTTCWG